MSTETVKISLHKTGGELLSKQISFDLFMRSLIGWLNRHHDEFLAEDMSQYDQGLEEVMKTEGDPFHEVIEYGSFVYDEHKPHTRDWLNCIIYLFTDLSEEERADIDERHCSPDIGVVTADNWAVIRLGKNIAPETKRWIFCFKDDDGVFGEISLPQGWELNVHNGEIAVPAMDVTFAPYEYPWPYQAQKPEMCLSIALLEKLLEGGKTNPLTILLQSPQPYKGLAAQINKQLSGIVGRLTKRPNWNFE